MATKGSAAAISWPLCARLSLLFGCQVGIMHTNYLDYARREEGGETKAKLLEAYNNWVCRVHCHKVQCI